MTSVIVPPVDLAPGMPSRVVAISATDITEGGQSLAGQMVRFALSDTLDVTSGGDVIAKTQAEVVLDSNGEGRIRLPVYTDAVKTWCGDPDWAILVTATWGSQKAIRVPAGSTSIALSSLAPVRPLRGREKQWALTGASVSVTEGAQWDIDVSLSGGVLDFDFTVPPGATAFSRGNLATGTDWNTVKEPGLYGISAGASYINTSPGYVPGSNGSLLVGGVGTSWATHLYVQQGTSPVFEWRSTSTSVAWNAWRTVPTDFVKHNLAPTNLNAVYTPGIYVLPAPFPTGYSGVPREITTAAILFVQGGGNGTWASQEIVQYGGNPVRLWRMSRNTVGEWNAWQSTGDSTKAPASDAHALRVQAFKDAYPLVSTGGKGAVVLRFDHGLTNFKSTIWPLLQQHQVKAYVAMNSRLWSDAENAGASQADARAWIASGLVEFGNHTADHEDRSTSVGMYDNIVNGRIELEAQLGTTIHGFTVPGLAGFNQFEGFGNGSLDAFSGTYAGGVILANHGITSGAIGQSAGASRRVLDGQVRQGGRHYTWESAAWADIKQQIDSAVTNKAALTLMAHPRTMGGSGYFTAALAGQVIAYIRERIDAGDLADLSYYQSHRAQLEPITEGVDVDAALAAYRAAIA